MAHTARSVFDNNYGLCSVRDYGAVLFRRGHFDSCGPSGAVVCGWWLNAFVLRIALVRSCNQGVWALNGHPKEICGAWRFELRADFLFATHLAKTE